MDTIDTSKKYRALDLETFEFDEAPAFIIRVGSTALNFGLLYTNEAFRNGRFRDDILANDREALLFRSWAQALVLPADSQYDFGGCTWTAELATKSAALKTVRAVHFLSEEHCSKGTLKLASNESLQSIASSTLGCERTKADHTKEVIQDRPALFPILPRTNLTARWEGIQTMLEMSDVGVFEYNLEGKLMHANKSYYRRRWATLLQPR
jgi:hypothetical protein